MMTKTTNDEAKEEDTKNLNFFFHFEKDNFPNEAENEEKSGACERLVEKIMESLPEKCLHPK
jgi:hypothetical protein